MASKRSQDREIVDRVAGECLAVRLRVLHRTISAIYDEELRPVGLTVGQMNILAVLSKLGPAEPGAVAKVLHMEKSTVSRNVERMKERGWVQASPGADGRRIALKVSGAGRGVLQRAFPAWERAQERAKELLGKDTDLLFEVSDRAWGGQRGGA